MFERPHHRRVAEALRALDADLLDEARCFFGGGTAIVLALGEYRESVDIDLLCASQEGYRLLRQRVWGVGFEGLTRGPSPVRALRELRADQYGLRTVLEVGGVPIKFEVVREARITLAGARDPGLGVPVLSREDLYVEKLLANADRGLNPATMGRDVIDLSMMIARWGPVPEPAWAKARGAYGETVDAAWHRAVAAIRDPARLDACLRGLSMSPDLAAEVLAPHGGPLDPGRTEADRGGTASG